MVLAPGANVPADANSAPAARDEPVPGPTDEPVARSSGRVATRTAPAVVSPSPRLVDQEPVAAAPAPSAPAVSAPAPSAPPVSPESSAPIAAAGATRFAFQQEYSSVREGDVAARITIRRSGDLSGSATVSWWTEQGTALADADYADLGARIEIFGAGEASRTVYVPLTNDAAREPSKSFRVLLGRGEGADVAAGMRIDIVDDD